MYIQMCRLTDEITVLFILIIEGLNPYWIRRGEVFIKCESSPPAVLSERLLLGAGLSHCVPDQLAEHLIENNGQNKQKAIQKREEMFFSATAEWI